MLGPGLQPSVFGILLIMSLAAFANGRPILAAGLAAASGVMHSTYLLPAGLMTLGYMLVLCASRRLSSRDWRPALFALVIVLPAVIYNLRSFSPGNPDEFQAAQTILAEVRIPHHAVVEQWLDAVAVDPDRCHARCPVPRAALRACSGSLVASPRAACC